MVRRPTEQNQRRSHLQYLTRKTTLARLYAVLIVTTLVSPLLPGEAIKLPNIHEQPSDLTIPALSDGPPGAGKRVREILSGYEDWNLFHVLYLPADWIPGEKYPVIVEFPGNGGYRNKLGDESTGLVEDCKLGYGITAGRGFIWVSLPFVDPSTRKHTLNWWGDADATAAYCRQAVAHICKEHGGDPDSVILTGFSRGSIACSYIGLRDDETAKLWRAMILHSHYDGVRKWSYPEADTESARVRWARFEGKPQFVTQEQSIENIREFLDGKESPTISLHAIPFPNHTDVWILKDIPERRLLRDWLNATLQR